MAHRNYSVKLEFGECLQVALIGILRQVDNRLHLRKDRYGADPSDGWGYHIEGAGGEYALARCLCIFYNGNLGNFKARDVGKLQVRTRSKHNWDLILHDADRDDDIFVLVTGTMPEYRIRGWIYGKEGKKKEFLADPSKNAGKDSRPAYFVKAEFLHPMAELEPLLLKIQMAESERRQKLGGLKDDLPVAS